MTKEIDVSAGNMDSDKLPIQSMSLEGGVKYWVELTVINDQGMESEKQSTDFTMPDDIKKGSAGTVISVMVGIIFSEFLTRSYSSPEIKPLLLDFSKVPR